MATPEQIRVEWERLAGILERQGGDACLRAAAEQIAELLDQTRRGIRHICQFCGIDITRPTLSHGICIDCKRAVSDFRAVSTSEATHTLNGKA